MTMFSFFKRKSQQVKAPEWASFFNKDLYAVILFIGFAVSGYTQTPAKIGGIDNVLTDQHLNIPGTRLFLVPPKGFHKTTAFCGLMREDKSALQVYDLVGGNYYLNAATFGREEFEKKGIKVFTYQELKVNHFPAKYLFGQGDPEVKTMMIVFGDSTFSTMIATQYPSDDQQIEKEILKSIRSIYYDTTFVIDPFKSASFELDDRQSVLKFKSYSAGMFMYSIPGSDDKDCMVVVTTVPRDSWTSARDVADMFVSKMEKYGLIQIQQEQTSAADVNGYSAFETSFYGRMNGDRKINYLLVILGKEKAIVLQGMAFWKFEYHLEEMKKLARTVKLK